MNREPAIFVSHVSKVFHVQTRTDATILSRMADFLPSGTKRHSSRKIDAVQDVSFTLNKGEVLGIIGRNASGKTTLLRMIAGILQPDSGFIHTTGKITSLISLSVGLENRLTVRDNIFLTCSMYGMLHKEIKHVLMEILRFAEIEECMYMYPYQLSQGTNQKLAFAIAVHTQPEILLLDEVFSAGDIHFQEKANAKMSELIRSDVTVVMVSHGIEKLQTLSDTVLWMDNGKMKQVGDPHTVVCAYKNCADNTLISA